MLFELSVTLSIRVLLKDGWTGLMIAAKSNQPGVARCLISAGADVNADVDVSSCTACLSATWILIRVRRDGRL